jgi:hypothetical protein
MTKWLVALALLPIALAVKLLERIDMSVYDIDE